MTATLPRPANPLRLWQDAPILAGLTVLVALAALPLMLAMGLDARRFQDDSIWLKPLKFHVALVIYTATLAIYARWLPVGLMQRRGWRIYMGVVATAIIAELAWIGGAAAMGTASHFNISTPVWAVIYPVMGVAAVTLTSASATFGVAIARNPATGLDPALKLSLVLGLILTFVLTVIVAGTLSQNTGHLVGTPVTGARMAVMGWSREVGDLRVAHFLATHALHAIPLAGLLATGRPASRAIVIGASLGYAALVLATFAQALSGQPLI